MLALLPAAPNATRVEGRFPDECEELLAERRGQADCVLAYGVLSCVFEDGNVFDFVDRCLELLTPGGQLLLADVPNLSKRKRFFASDAGRRFHENFMGGSAPLDVQFNVLDPGTLDDGVILGLRRPLSRRRLRRLCRASGERSAVREPPRGHPGHPTLSG